MTITKTLLAACVVSSLILGYSTPTSQAQELPVEATQLSERASACVAEHRALFDTNDFSAERPLKFVYAFSVLDNDKSKVEGGIDGIRPMVINHGAEFTGADVQRNVRSVKAGSATMMLYPGQLAYIHSPEEFTDKDVALASLKSMCSLYDNGIQLLFVRASVRIL